MAEPNKAQITYKVGAATSVLRFHSVIAEEHEITSEVTKYPAMTGFNVSTHAIKKNRKLTIQGAVSNHLIVGSEEFHVYGGKNTAIMFDTLKNLVRLATPCEVLTNLGTYTPVVFTRFRTKQQAGMTDAMDFTLIGEEIQLGTAKNSTAPKLLVFTPLSAVERKARVDELESSGWFVPEDARLSQCLVDLNDSFQVETKNEAGKTFITTYEKSAYDPSTKSYSHTVHTSDTDVATSSASTSFNWFALMQGAPLSSALPDIDLIAGAETAGACLVDGVSGFVTNTLEEMTETTLGELKKTIYGAAYGVLGVNGDRSPVQALLAIGVDCLVAGAIGSVDPTLNADDFTDSSLPTIESILEGAAATGDSVVNDVLGAAAPTTLTKISPATRTTSFFGDLL